MKKKQRWPEWWDWELEFTPHLLKRMEDRQFNEIDLRTMLEHARSYQQNIIEGRWVIETQHEEHAWEVIVEPDMIGKLFVVVTSVSSIFD